MSIVDFRQRQRMKACEQFARTALGRGEREALHRLLDEASRDDPGSRVCATFLLSWWTTDKPVSFRMADLLEVNAAMREDLATVFRLAARGGCYPDAWGGVYLQAFENLEKHWADRLSADE